MAVAVSRTSVSDNSNSRNIQGFNCPLKGGLRGTAQIDPLLASSYYCAQIWDLDRDLENRSLEQTQSQAISYRVWPNAPSPE
jgi:hypothetical protein